MQRLVVTSIDFEKVLREELQENTQVAPPVVNVKRSPLTAPKIIDDFDKEQASDEEDEPQAVLAKSEANATPLKPFVATTKKPASLLNTFQAILRYAYPI